MWRVLGGAVPAAVTAAIVTIGQMWLAFGSGLLRTELLDRTRGTYPVLLVALAYYLACGVVAGAVLGDRIGRRMPVGVAWPPRLPSQAVRPTGRGQAAGPQWSVAAVLGATAGAATGTGYASTLVAAVPAGDPAHRQVLVACLLGLAAGAGCAAVAVAVPAVALGLLTWIGVLLLVRLGRWDGGDVFGTVRPPRTTPDGAGSLAITLGVPTFLGGGLSWWAGRSRFRWPLAAGIAGPILLILVHVVVAPGAGRTEDSDARVGILGWVVLCLLTLGPAALGAWLGGRGIGRRPGVRCALMLWGGSTLAVAALFETLTTGYAPVPGWCAATLVTVTAAMAARGLRPGLPARLLAGVALPGMFLVLHAASGRYGSTAVPWYEPLPWLALAAVFAGWGTGQRVVAGYAAATALLVGYGSLTWLYGPVAVAASLAGCAVLLLGAAALLPDRVAATGPAAARHVPGCEVAPPPDTGPPLPP